MDSNAFSEKMNTIKNNNTINIDPRNNMHPKNGGMRNAAVCSN